MYLPLTRQVHKKTQKFTIRVTEYNLSKRVVSPKVDKGKEEENPTLQKLSTICQRVVDKTKKRIALSQREDRNQN